MNRLMTLLISLLITMAASAQDAEMADVMRANGKINVVVAVLATIFIGLIVFLIYLDRRVKKLEKESKG
ncbi:MAG: CcmD family protein [Bacteroidetes bacterium]|nr:CcmD family protein [Bacteroidota bacterium]